MMTEFVPITAERHGALRWRRFTSYAFARDSAMVGLVAAELPKASMALPIALAPRESATTDSSEAGPETGPKTEPVSGFMPAAVLGLEPGQNLFVGADGRWLGRFVPAALRGYPFRLFRADARQLALCIDEASGLVAAQGDEPFFDDKGEVATPVRQVMDFLTQVENNRAATRNSCDCLERHGLIEPWPVRLQGSEGEHPLTGLYRVKEAALNDLPAAALAEVRDAGALALAYCQLLSMQHLGMLGELARARAAQAPRLDDMFAFEDDGILHFG